MKSETKRLEDCKIKFDTVGENIGKIKEKLKYLGYLIGRFESEYFYVIVSRKVAGCFSKKYFDKSFAKKISTADLFDVLNCEINLKKESEKMPESLRVELNRQWLTLSEAVFLETASKPNNIKLPKKYTPIIINKSEFILMVSYCGRHWRMPSASQDSLRQRFSVREIKEGKPIIISSTVRYIAIKKD